MFQNIVSSTPRFENDVLLATGRDDVLLLQDVIPLVLKQMKQGWTHATAEVHQFFSEAPRLWSSMPLKNTDFFGEGKNDTR